MTQWAFRKNVGGRKFMRETICQSNKLIFSLWTHTNSLSPHFFRQILPWLCFFRIQHHNNRCCVPWKWTKIRRSSFTLIVGRGKKIFSRFSGAAWRKSGNKKYRRRWWRRKVTSQIELELMERCESEEKLETMTDKNFSSCRGAKKIYRVGHLVFSSAERLLVSAKSFSASFILRKLFSHIFSLFLETIQFFLWCD